VEQGSAGEKTAAELPRAELPALPATYVNTPGCPGCLALTLTLRPDGSYLVRDQLGVSEFYDFGRWRLVGGMLDLAGGRDTRRYPLHSLRRAAQVEMLRGPFRLVGLYDGTTFKECRTGLAWKLADTRAAKVLNQEFVSQQSNPVLVTIDARFEGSPETLLVQRPASLLNARACPG
jgi:hypothetical protein